MSITTSITIFATLVVVVVGAVVSVIDIVFCHCSPPAAAWISRPPPSGWPPRQMQEAAGLRQDHNTLFLATSSATLQLAL